MRSCGRPASRWGSSRSLGMINVNVIRDSDGKDWVHDVNPENMGFCGLVPTSRSGFPWCLHLVALWSSATAMSGACLGKARSSKSFRWLMQNLVPMSPHSGSSVDSPTGAPVHRLPGNLVCGLRVTPPDRHQPGRFFPPATPCRGSSAVAHSLRAIGVRSPRSATHAGSTPSHLRRPIVAPRRVPVYFPTSS